MGITRVGLGVFLAAFALLLASVSSVRSEDTTEPLRLELKLTRKPQGVSVLLDPDTVRTDTDKVISQIEARKRVEVLIRETIEHSRRRPDLTYDVFSGIQSRNLTNALQ